MQDTDKDIEVLKGLLGGTTAEYQALRHPGTLRRDYKPARRRIRPRTYGIAASILLIASVLTLTGDNSWSPGKTTVTSRLALKKPYMPLTLRPEHKLPKPISFDRLKMAKGRLHLRIPRRPTESKG